MNKLDGGNRHFISIEMMNYAETVTSERVKRVISGYSDVSGLDGSFSYYELGPQFKVHGDLNSEIDLEEIRRFVFYTETKQPYVKSSSSNPAYIGNFGDTAYYLLFGDDMPSVLDDSFLPLLEQSCSSHVIYADVCYIPDNVLDENNIRFKKIPRDIRGC
jgi:adenine-specific DNA-methyltransferase